MDEDWKSFLEKADDATKTLFVPIVRNFFIPDRIDLRKFLANYHILLNEGREIWKMRAHLTGDVDYSEHGTKSIDVLGLSINRPIGYEKWFVAAYPDVVLWGVTSLKKDGDNALGKILGDVELENLISKEGIVKQEYLRKIVDVFKKTGVDLECVKYRKLTGQEFVDNLNRNVRKDK